MNDKPNFLSQQYWNHEKASASIIASYSQQESDHENQISFYLKRGPKYYVEKQTDNNFVYARRVSPERIRNDIHTYKRMSNVTPIFYSDKLMDSLYEKLAKKDSAFQGSFLPRSQFDKDHCELIAKYSSDKMNFWCYRDSNQDNLDYYCEIQNKPDIPLGVIKMSPKQMRHTISFLLFNCERDGEETGLTENLTRDLRRSEAYTDSLIYQFKQLSDDNIDIQQDDDTLLCQFVNDHVASHPSGIAQKVFELYQNPSQSKTVEQMFELFTGIDMNDYLKGCLTLSQNIEQSSEEELDEEELDDLSENEMDEI